MSWRPIPAQADPSASLKRHSTFRRLPSRRHRKTGKSAGSSVTNLWVIGRHSPRSKHLKEDACVCKEALENELRQDPAERVNYFKNAEDILPERDGQRVSVQASQFLAHLTPAYTEGSAEFLAPVQDANAKRIAQHQQAAGARAPPPGPRSIETVHQRHADKTQGRISTTDQRETSHPRITHTRC